MVVPLLRWTEQRLEFSSRPVHVRTVVDKMALGRAFLQVLRFSSNAQVSFIYLSQTINKVGQK
jgi:hypothetical protein